MLGLDERNAPLAVEVVVDLPGLEGIRGGELVAEAGLELDEVLVAVPVDQALLPLQPLRPTGGLREYRVVLAVQPLAAERDHPSLGHILVEAHERVDADLLQRAVLVADRQLLGVGGELRNRPRRAGDSGLLEERLVVVEAVRVREQWERAALAAVLRVVV